MLIFLLSSAYGVLTFLSGCNDDKASSDKWRMPAIVFNSVKKCIRYMCDVQGKGGPDFNGKKSLKLFWRRRNFLEQFGLLSNSKLL